MRDIFVDPVFGAPKKPSGHRTRSQKKKAPSPPKTHPPHSPQARSDGSQIHVINESPTKLSPFVYDSTHATNTNEDLVLTSYRFPIYQYMKFSRVLKKFGDKFWNMHGDEDRQYIQMMSVYFPNRDTNEIDDRLTPKPLTNHAKTGNGGGFLSYHFKEGPGHYLFYTFEKPSDTESPTVTVYDPDGRASIVQNEIQVTLKFQYNTRERDLDVKVQNAKTILDKYTKKLTEAQTTLSDIDSSVVKPTANIAHDLDPVTTPVTPASKSGKRRLWTPYKEITREEDETNRVLEGQKATLLRTIPGLKAAQTRASNELLRCEMERKIHTDTTNATMRIFTETLVRRIMDMIREIEVDGQGIRVATARGIGDITYDDKTASVTIRCQPISVPEKYRGYMDSWMHRCFHVLSEKITREHVEKIAMEEFYDEMRDLFVAAPSLTACNLCVTRNFNHSTSWACDYFFQGCDVIFGSVPNLNMNVNATETSGASLLLQKWFTEPGAYGTHLYIRGMCACLACLYFINWVQKRGRDWVSEIVHDHRLLYLSKKHGEILILITAIGTIVDSLKTIGDTELATLMTEYYSEKGTKKPIANDSSFATYNRSIRQNTFDTYKSRFTLKRTGKKLNLYIDDKPEPIFTAEEEDRRSSIGFIENSTHTQIDMC